MTGGAAKTKGSNPLAEKFTHINAIAYSEFLSTTPTYSLA
jgi:hypothetical protein